MLLHRHRAPLLAALCCAALSAGVARAAQEGRAGGPTAEQARALAERMVRVGLACAPATAFPGQGVELTVLVEVETGFLTDELVQPFRNRLDLPLRLEAPWLDRRKGTLDGARILPSADDPADGPTLVVGEGLARARALPEDRVADGLRFRRFVLHRRLAPTKAGTLSVPPVRVHLAFATRFEVDLLGDRVPVDRHDVVVTSPELRIPVHALPAEGRPADFSGAVGTFTLRAEAEPRSLVLGEATTLVVAVDGDGDLGDVRLAVPAGMRAFHVSGRIEDRRADRLRLTWTLVPRDVDVRALPIPDLVTFVPGAEGGYRRQTTEPIPLEVRPGPDGATSLPGLPPPIATGPGPEAAPGAGAAGTLSGIGPLTGLGEPDPSAEGSATSRLRSLWAEGRHDEARAMLGQALVDPTLDPGQVLQALGDTAWRRDRPAEAIAFWLRALVHRPGDPLLQDDLRLARTRLGVPPAPGPSPLAVLAALLDALPVPGLLALALGLAAVVLRLRGPRRLAPAATVVLVASVCALLVLALAPATPAQGVVLTARLQVMPEPHRDLVTGFELKAGEQFELVEASDRWIRLRHRLGEGWVERDRVALVGP